MTDEVGLLLVLLDDVPVLPAEDTILQSAEEDESEGVTNSTEEPSDWSSEPR